MNRDMLALRLKSSLQDQIIASNRERKPIADTPEDEEFMYSKILVHSIQTCRLQKLCAYAVSRRKPVLFIGNSGTGKTVVIKDFLSRTDPEAVTYANINFNSYTTAPDVQINLELKLINKTKEIKGCLGAKILVYFVDDLNMQAPDTYNT